MRTISCFVLAALVLTLRAAVRLAISLRSVGAYEPRSIMVEHHATPEEGVAIGKDAGAQTLIGHHWGALRLTTEDPFEPPGRFREAATEAGYDIGHVEVMRVGETLALTKARPSLAPQASEGSPLEAKGPV